jgi:cation transport regulator ChaB
LPDGVMNNLSHHAQVAAHKVAWAGSEERNEEARDEDPKRK